MPKASNDNRPNQPGGKTRPPCPICGETSLHDYRPFCSKRCADVDLGRWMTGRYVIQADPGGEEADSVPLAEQNPEEW